MAYELPTDKEERERLESELQRYIASPPFWLRFAPDFDEQFENHGRPGRLRRFQKAMLWVMGFALIMGISDFFLIPQFWAFVSTVRLAFATTCLLVSCFLLPQIEQVPLREKVLASLVVIGATLQAWVTVRLSPAGHLEYGLILLLFMFFSNLVLRLRFHFSLPLSVILLGLLCATQIAARHQMDPDAWHTLLVVAAMTLMSLTTKHAMELDNRKFFALKVINEITHERLEAANSLLSVQAFIDPLTSLVNRRELDSRHARLHKNAIRNQTPISILFIDVDHFKLFNDTYGHQAGDDCLRWIASILHEIVERPLDVVARFGGEEFVVLLPATTETGAFAIAERIRQSVFAVRQLNEFAHLKRVTVSIGVAGGVPDEEERPEHLLHAADQALYRAKELGRNAVYCASRSFEDRPPPSA